MAKNFIDPDILRDARKSPILSKEEEHDLAIAWRDHQSSKAFNKLIFSHIRLVYSIANNFRNYRLPIADLHQEGVIGLIEAVKRFDPDINVRFSTYAQWWVRSYMTEYVQRNFSVVRISTNRAHKSLFFNLRKMRTLVEKRNQNMGEHLTPEIVKDIAEVLGVKEEDVRVMEQRLSVRDSSLNVPVGEEGNNEAIDFLPDETPNPEDLLLENEKLGRRAELLYAAIDELTEREKFIVMERRLNDKPATLESIGKALGISKERVRQVEQRSIVKLMDILKKKIDEPEDII